ncbi:MAG: DUF2480 family protein [Bacteroidetes bacterium]|nr:MAG: DUF2480 family protein [Bacteroidota bacterium]
MIENKVAKSGLITLDLQEIIAPVEVVSYDLKQNLYEGLVLREKDFREFIKTHDWSVYKDQYVAVYCSADAIIQPWAYMLIATAMRPYAKEVFAAAKEEALKILLLRQVENMDVFAFQDARVLIKGCADVPFFETVVTALTQKLLPVVKSLMYGEACSSVPVFKKK